MGSSINAFAGDVDDFLTWYNDDHVYGNVDICELEPYKGVHGARIKQNTNVGNAFVITTGLTGNCTIDLCPNDTIMYRTYSPIYFHVQHIDANQYYDKFQVTMNLKYGIGAYQIIGEIWY